MIPRPLSQVKINQNIFSTYSIQYTLYSIQYTVYSIQSIQYTVGE